jgi:hypothetical protein
MQRTFLENTNNALCTKDQAPCEEEAMEGHVHKEKEEF